MILISNIKENNIPDGMIKCRECGIVVPKHNSRGGLCRKCYEYFYLNKKSEKPHKNYFEKESKRGGLL
jgi:NMD protein affecting ribosome stability and mRNA decay